MVLSRFCSSHYHIRARAAWPVHPAAAVLRKADPAVGAEPQRQWTSLATPLRLVSPGPAISGFEARFTMRNEALCEATVAISRVRKLFLHMESNV